MKLDKGPSALDVQVGGDHYKKLKIQPTEYIFANNIPYIEGNVIKYMTRWRDKGGIDDLQKAKHYIDLLMDFERRAKAEAALQALADDAQGLGLGYDEAP